MKQKPTHNEMIMKVLTKAAGKPVGVETLSKRTGIPRTSIYKRVHELSTERGVQIERTFKKVAGKRMVFYSAAAA